MKRYWAPLAASIGFFAFLLVGILDVNTSWMGEDLHCIMAACSFVMVVTGLAATTFSSKYPILLRGLSGLLSVFVIGICFAAYCYGVSLRNAALIFGKSDLKQALMHYQQYGYPTNFSSNSEIWVSSNAVNVAGSNYECFLTVRSARFNGEGLLAMTTNGVFIWIDKKRGPKIIHAKYRSPFFPPIF